MHVFQRSPPLVCKSGKSYLRRILSIQKERGDSFCVLSFSLLPPAARLLKHEPCTSRYMACVHSRSAMKLVELELLVWTRTRGESCVLWLSASSLGNILLLLWACLTWRKEIWRLWCPYGACKFALCSVNFAAVVLETPPARAIPLA